MSRFKIVKVEPIGTRSGPAFVHRTTGCSLENMTFPVYPDSPLGDRLRRARLDAGCGLRDGGRLLGLTPEQFSGLEVGRYVFENQATWDEVFALLADAAKEGG